MKITKSELKEMVNALVEEAAKPNVGIDKSMLAAIVKDLNKVKEGTIDLKAKLSASQFNEFNNSLVKIYNLIEGIK